MITRNLIIGLACFLPLAVVSGADRDYVEDADFTRTVEIVFNGNSATITDGAGVTISYGATTSAIAITSAVPGVEYVLSGSATDGYVQITSTYDSKVTLNGVALTSSTGPALSVLSSARNFITLPAGTMSVLADSASYSRTGTGTIYSSGPLIFSGQGALSVTGKKSHAISSATYIRALGGDITVPAAVKDAVHATGAFLMDLGTLDLTPSGDGVDAATVEIRGGSLKVLSAVDDTKGINCGGALAVTGGAINMTVTGMQSKALASDGDFIQSGGVITLNLSGAPYLEQVAGSSFTYTDPSYCTGIKCKGNITISAGAVTLTHTGTAGKGISGDGDISITGGTLDLATTGGVTASYTDEDGATDTASCDALKADGNLTISGGGLTLYSEGVAADGISAEGTLEITGGSFDFTSKGAKSKALKSDGVMTLSGGVMAFTLSGAVALENVTTTTYDPSYCTAIKAGSTLNITGGTCTIAHTGVAGKGISGDGDISITGGIYSITASGAASSTYRNSSNATDIATSKCLKADGNLTITGGTITATATGTGGDAMSCDGVATIGVSGVADSPVISANTTGVHVLVSGSGNSADYAQPKAFAAGGNLTMNGGIFKATTTQDGGEGMESKANLTINGGTVEISSYDDCINASTKVTINGGNIYCYSSGNDGIDSNGTMLITGGTIVSSGTNSPEEGFDCDNNNFTITGGTLIGTGGATSTPTASTSTQRSVIYKGAGTANVILQVKSASGSVLVYKIPRTYSGGGGGGGGSSSAAMTMLFSTSGIASGTTYTIVSGATISGGTEFHGLYTGATVTGGTTLKTFTPSSMVTTVQ